MRLRKFRALSGENKSMVLEALGLMTFITLAFRAVGVPRTQAALRSDNPGIAPTEPLQTIAAAKRALLRVKRATGFGGTCLSRSFALSTILRRRGIDTDLKIGYRNKDGIIEGHAWLEYAGNPINEEPDVIATYTLATHSSDFNARWA